MKTKPALILAVILGVPTGGTFAQSVPDVPPQAATEPAAEPELLALPMGAQVRVRTAAAPGAWIQGILVSADSGGLALVPAGAPPIGANQLRFPIASVERFELQTGKKRHALHGLIAGVALGVLAGVTAEVDPVACEYDVDYMCSRGEAVTVLVLGFGVLGAAVGGVVKTDEWTPVALDTLAPPPPRLSRVAPRLRVLPRGGVTVGVAVGF
jgi:hypothetical protein